MGFNFENNLPHQMIAINSVVNVFDRVSIIKNKNSMCNPVINLYDPILEENIKQVKDINKVQDKNILIQDVLNLDIKMETGTGKTYTYVKTIFELNKRYKINKFIIVVPTLAIKLGTENFIKSDSARQHFRTMYHKDISLEVLSSQKQKKKKRKEFLPSQIQNFISATTLDQNIQVLLINTGMLNSKTMEKVFDDNNIFNYAGTPIELVSKVRPIVILDEPHKYKRNSVSYNNLLKLKPQVIIRYGATFPESKSGKKDYENLLYNLTAAKAFNDDLVKGVVVHIPKINNQKDIKVTLVSIDPPFATFKYEDEKKSNVYKLSKNNSLAIIHSDFHNVFIEKMNKNAVVLSNGITMYKRTSIHPTSFSNSYQEVLMRKAIDEHFIKEIELFHRPTRIKPLTLFFIDDKSSYRDNEGTSPYIKNLFEKILKEKINSILKTEEISSEYESYLQESLAFLELTHGGYFSSDNSESDEKIQDEIDEILRDKESLIRYKKNDEWNVRRFIFSKWTLKEGWDNPNVFTICKLRSSGSEISKLQEVGRGLRLPVNEAMFRVKDTDFELSYIVDFTEKNFADKLISEINQEAMENKIDRITDEMLISLAKEYNKTDDEMFDELRNLGYIDRKLGIIESKREELYAAYPSLRSNLKSGKVRKQENIKPKVRVKTSCYNEFKELWEKINQKVFIEYRIGNESDIAEILLKVLQGDIYGSEVISILEQRLIKEEENLTLNTSKSYYELDSRLPYREFLHAISKQTSIPYQTIHNTLVKFNSISPIDQDKFFNLKVAHNIAKNFNIQINHTLEENLVYRKINLSVHPTELTNLDGSLKAVSAYKLGTKYSDKPTPDKYLYEELYYDSNECDTISENIESIVVFGKIPKESIRIPVIGGHTYSPDFAYVVKGKDKTTRLHLVLESKNKDEKDLSSNEKMKINLANRFFNTINDSGIKVVFETQYKGISVKSIVDGIRNKEHA